MNAYSHKCLGAEPKEVSLYDRTVGQGLTALAVGAGGGWLDTFILIYPFSPLSPSPWETARYRLKYCLEGPLNPKQPTNQQLYDRKTKSKNPKKANIIDCWFIVAVTFAILRQVLML